MISAAVLAGTRRTDGGAHVPAPAGGTGGVLLKTLGSEVCGTDVHLPRATRGRPVPDHPGPRERRRDRRDRCGDQRSTSTASRSPSGRSSRSSTSTGTAGAAGTARSVTRRPAARRARSTASRCRPTMGSSVAGRVHLPPAGCAHRPAPAELDWRAFLSAGCGMPTALHAVSLGDVASVTPCLVQGAGPVGLSAAVLAQLRGAGQVIVIGGPEVRLAAAKRFGADTTIDIGTTSERSGSRRSVSSPAAGARTSRSRRPASRRRCRKACGSPATPAATWSSGSTPNAGDATFNPHLDLNQKHLDVAAAGAATSATSTAPSRSWQVRQAVPVDGADQR